MKFYQHVKVPYRSPAFVGARTWLSRITREWTAGEFEEIWLVFLPSYGMEYSITHDQEVWSQRGFWWNLRTNEHSAIYRPVENWAMR